MIAVRLLPRQVMLAQIADISLSVRVNFALSADLKDNKERGGVI